MTTTIMDSYVQKLSRWPSSWPLSPTLSIALLSLLSYLFYRLYIHPNYISSICHIDGPPRDSLFSGNLQTVFKADAGVPHKEWADKYGSTFVYGGFMGQNRLYITDPKALAHILVHRAYDYPKPMQLRVALARILGEGVLFVEGDQHKRQRRVLNGPFTQASVNSYIPIFQELAEKLVSKMNDSIDNDKSLEKKGDHTVINVYNWLSRVTLDAIGQAGFDYNFGALDDEENELAKVFQNMLHPRKITLGMIGSQWLMHHLPFLTKIPNKATNRINDTKRVMQREGGKMLDERRQQAANGELEGKKDLLSLLVKANLEAKNPKDQLRDDELMGQLSTFSLAGHETSSVALTWILYYLCLHPEVQKKVRAEVFEIQDAMEAQGRTVLSPDDIAKMPYMDAVVRETLRFAPPVYLTNREPAGEDVIPLSEPITGRDGRQITSIPVTKGQQIVIGIYTLNRSKQLYGEDADEFKPERWLEDDTEKRDRSAEKAFSFTAWSPLMTFLAGPRGCIGYKFSIAEVKVILYALVLNFEFLERDEDGTPISRRSNVVTRPIIVGEEEKGGQLPLRVKRVKRSHHF